MDVNEGASDDDTARIWDARSGKSLAVLNELPGSLDGKPGPSRQTLHPRARAAQPFQAELALREMGTPSLLVALDYLEPQRRLRLGSPGLRASPDVAAAGAAIGSGWRRCAMSVAPVVRPVPPGRDASGEPGAPKHATATWLKVAGLAVGLAWGGGVIVVCLSTAPDRTWWILLAFLLAVGVALIAWRFPAVIGGLLVVGAALLLPAVVWAINFGRAWAEEPGGWGAREDALLALVCGLPFLSGVLLIAARIAQHRRRG